MNQEKQIMHKLVQQMFMVVVVFIIIICSSKGTEVSLHIPQDLLDVCSLNPNNIRILTIQCCSLWYASLGPSMIFKKHFRCFKYLVLKQKQKIEKLELLKVLSGTVFDLNLGI